LRENASSVHLSARPATRSTLVPKSERTVLAGFTFPVMYGRTLLLVGSVLTVASLGCQPVAPEPSPGGTGGSPTPTAGKGGDSSNPTPTAGTSGGSGGSSGSSSSGSGGSGGSGAGSGGSGGSSAGSGGSSQTDTAPAPSDAAAAPDTGPSAPPAGGGGPYNCTRYYGINATAEWYNQGFETMVDGAKWELVRVHSGFVDKWAEPNSAFWNTNPTSACAGGAKPDRVIFVGLKFEWTSTDLWTTALTGVVKNLKDKFPGLKSIELATYVRAPGNKPCPQGPPYRSTIHPSQDEAIAKVVATDPVLLKASPKFEATSCSDFSGNPPHFTAAGGKKVAAILGAYYGGAK
jgi:hypothetical protein